jgi:hypothetical protein
MAWEWSHTAEGLEAARENVHRLDDETLAVIYAEWRASTPGRYGDWAFHASRYPLALVGARKLVALSRETVADAIWERMEELRTCENGGHLAWACPHGCGCHLVSFSTPDEEEQESV